ncbi:MAG: hypothetical protein HOE75_04745 [Chloroflexi bacterium]|nr:hypothetical protein [Chloroflexota bacterium]
MTTEQDVIGQVESASKHELDDVIRAIFEDPAASVIPGWTANSLGMPVNGIGSLAILKVEGAAVVGGATMDWSVVLKVMTSGADIGPGKMGSVDREVEAYRQGIFEDRSVGFRAAHVYAISEKEHGDIWLWTEDLSGFDGNPWSADTYIQAGESLGRLNGNLLRQPSVAGAWMNRRVSASRWIRPDFMAYLDLLAGARESEYVRRAFPGNLYDRALSFPADFSRLVDLADRLPESLAHADCHVRNLFASTDNDGRFELIAIDLAAVGIESVGTDAGTLLGSSLTWGDEEADTVIRAEPAFFGSFMEGLHSENPEVSEELIRLGYLTAICGYGLGASAIPVMVDARARGWEGVAKRYGEGDAIENLPDSYRVRIEFIATLFDEAVELVDRVISKL